MKRLFAPRFHPSFIINAILATAVVGLSGCSLLPKSLGSQTTDLSNPTSAAVASSSSEGDSETSGRFEWPSTTKDVALGGLSPLMRGAFIGNIIKFGEVPVPLAAWWLDMTPGQASVSQQLAFVEACVKEQRSAVETMMQWAVCAEDAKDLDRNRFASEIKELDAAAQRSALAHFDKVAKLAATRAAEATALAKDDPGMAMMLVERPKTARAEWAAAVKRRGSTVSDSIAVFDAWRTGTKKAIAGCDATLWPHVEKWVKTIDDKDTHGDLLSLMAADPAGHPLTLAMHGCYGTDTSNAVRSGPWAGPRVAVLQAMWRGDLEFDRKEDTEAAKRTSVLNWPEWPVSLRPSKRVSRERGVIANISKADGKVTVTFKAIKSRYQKCGAERDTERIDRIKDGQLIYQKVCTRWDWATSEGAPDPVVIPVRFAAGLEAGRYVETIEYEEITMPIVVRRSAEPTSAIVARAGVML